MAQEEAGEQAFLDRILRDPDELSGMSRKEVTRAYFQWLRIAEPISAAFTALGRKDSRKNSDDVRDELWTVQRTALYLGVRPRTIQSRIRSGALAAIKDGRIVRISRAAVERWQEMRSKVRPA